MYFHQYYLELDREFLCYDDNDDLPEGWIRCNHESGMPVYLHEEMKVCTFSKPYFLGANSLKVSTLYLIYDLLLLSSKSQNI